MPVTIRNNTGQMLSGSDGRINDFTSIEETKTSIHKLPGADKDLVQKMGTSNRRFTLKGFVTTSQGSQFIGSCKNNTGSLLSTSNLGTIVATVVVLFYNLQFRDSGMRPLERQFTIEAVEII